MARDKDYAKLIQSARWRRLRREVLTVHPLCQRCKDEGRLTAATEVHHVRPVEEAVTYSGKESLMFDAHNLRALCHDCHTRTHMELGRGTKEQQRKRNSEQIKRVVGRFFGEDDAEADPGGVIF